jgi:hypothetical protein
MLPIPLHPRVRSLRKILQGVVHIPLSQLYPRFAYSKSGPFICVGPGSAHGTKAADVSMNSSTGYGTMLKNGLHRETPVTWAAYLPSAWTHKEYRAMLTECFFQPPPDNVGSMLKIRLFVVRKNRAFSQIV